MNKKSLPLLIIFIVLLVCISALGCVPMNPSDAKWLLYEGVVTSYYPQSGWDGDDIVVFDGGKCFQEYKINHWVCNKFSRSPYGVVGKSYKLYYYNDKEYLLIPLDYNSKPNDCRCGCE